MRNTSTMMLTIATFRQLDFTFCSTPPRHELQSVQSSDWSLLHVRQSASAPGNAVPVQSVAFTNTKPHDVGGLQHPDCHQSAIHQKSKSPHIRYWFGKMLEKGKSAEKVKIPRKEQYRERNNTEEGTILRKEQYRERNNTEKGRVLRKEQYRERKSAEKLIVRE
jgi:hypothetical protein